jgi:hypothetical protein
MYSTGCILLNESSTQNDSFLFFFGGYLKLLVLAKENCFGKPVHHFYMTELLFDRLPQGYIIQVLQDKAAANDFAKLL